MKNDVKSAKLCPICGNPVKFNGDVGEYRKTCSTSCSRRNPETSDKFKTTMSLKSDPFNVEKSRQTRFAKNGGKWHADDFARKTEKTLLAEHGDPHWNNREKFKNTSLEKYGVDHPMKNESVKRKLAESVKNKYGVESVFGVNEIHDSCKAGIRCRGV